jgi:hypothetical protein
LRSCRDCEWAACVV